MTGNGESANDGLPGELRELSKKLVQIEHVTKARQTARARAASAWRRSRLILVAGVTIALAAGSLLGLSWAGVPGASYALWLLGPTGFVLFTILFGVVSLFFISAAAVRQLATYVYFRQFTGRVRGVLLSADTVAMTLPSGKESYVPQISYVYDVGDVRHECTYRPRYVDYKSRRKVDRLCERFPAGRVVDIYFDPDNPAVSSLTRGAGGIAAAGLALAFIVTIWLVLAGLSLLFDSFAPFAAVALGALALLATGRSAALHDDH